MHVYCPHCDSIAHVRTAKKYSATLHDHYMRCTNIDCDHAFVTRVEIVYTTRESHTPKDNIHLPLSTRLTAAEQACGGK